MSWVREAITDDDDRVDVAYLSLMGVGGTIMGAVPFMCVMSLAAWWKCTANCTYDPQPLGIAIGAACAGFATAIGGLAGYMLATRPPRAAATDQTVTVTARTANVTQEAAQPAPAEAATEVDGWPRRKR